MMKNKFLVFILLIASIPLTYSQINEGAYMRMVDISINNAQFFEQYGLSVEDLRNIEGSPYANDLFLPGTIYNSEGPLVPSILLRYNIFADEIELKKTFNDSDTEYVSLIKSPEYFVKIAGKVYLFVNHSSGSKEGGYFNVLTEGKRFDLYKKTTVNYIEKKFAKTNYDRDVPAKFEKKDIFYLVSKDGIFYELPQKRNKFIDVFKDNKNDIKNYIKEKKLDIREEGDMITIVKYFNSLL